MKSLFDQGRCHFDNRQPLSLRKLTIALLATGLFHSGAILAADNVTAATSSSPISIGEVSESVAGQAYLGSKGVESLTQKHNFNSGQSMVNLNKAQIAAAGPVAGSAQALSYVPGLSVSSYGNTGATKNSISLNGLKQGWSGFTHGQKNGGTLSVTFDGIPMVDPSTGLWQSPEVSQMGMIQGINVTYGPGNPEDRWYNNIGGQINFVPVQPTKNPGADIKMTYGSYNQKNIYFDIRTGSIDGWSTVLAGGVGSGDSYRVSPVDGFSNPYSDYAWFIKTRKNFSNGDFSAGAYLSKGTGYRPTPVPVTPVAGLYDNGTSGALFSQQTSGFYSALPYNEWYKDDSNTTWIIYSKLNIALDSITGLHNMIWYRHGNRLHQHYYGPYVITSGIGSSSQEYEYNNPHDNVYGDKLWFTIKLPYNDVSFGGFFLNSHYNSRNQFYNTSTGGSIALPNGKYRNDVWNQTDLAAFLQDRISPISTLHITPGVRFINYQTFYTPGADIPGAAGTNQAIQPSSSKSFTKVEPSVDFNWKPVNWLAVFASYAQAYKEPGVGGGGGLFQAVPPDYSLEKSSDYNAGIKIHFDHAAYLHHAFAMFSFYHLNYSDEYATLYNGQGDYLGSALSDAIYQGVNISLEDNPIYNVHLFANLNFEEAKYNHYTFTNKSGKPTSFSGDPVANVPVSTLDIGASYKYILSGMLLKPAIWYQYNGAQNMFDNNVGAPSAQKIPAYGVLNLGLEDTIPTRGSVPLLKSVKLNLDVLNVTNNHYNAAEYISSGGLYNTSTGGYILAQPGAPLTVYGSISAHF